MEVQNQDIDNRTRGLLMHDIEAEIMSLNGIPVFDKPLESSLPIAHSTFNDIDAWAKITEFFAVESLAIERMRICPQM